ncbi:response regulator transcription factor [Vannielia litorea]|uniref:response regulator transcription factor n=1 Tax=Vannielia litorea TaxID=1217970 RepID=UPI001C941079|nr:response regulator transcription factor [Vannielia litorea]MBY6155592.1 response regulator transcription factor [Vannielia litorea]
MNILIAEDDPFHRAFLAVTVREALPGCEAVLEAEGGEQAVKLARDNRIDGVVMDIQMPEVSGIAAASRIWETRPDMRILFWSNYSDEAYVRGVSRIVPKEAVYGYVLKTASAQRLGLAMMGIFLEDQCIIDREVRGVQQRAMDLHEGLSNTEFEVLTDIALGLTDKAIAARRGISTRSVQSRLKQLYEKLGIDQQPHDDEGPVFNSRARAVALALSRGLLNLEGMSLGEAKLRRWLEKGQ